MFVFPDRISSDDVKALWDEPRDSGTSCPAEWISMERHGDGYVERLLGSSHADCWIPRKIAHEEHVSRNGSRRWMSGEPGSFVWAEGGHRPEFPGFMVRSKSVEDAHTLEKTADILDGDDPATAAVLRRLAAAKRALPSMESVDAFGSPGTYANLT